MGRRQKERYEVRVTGDDDGKPRYTLVDLHTDEVLYVGSNASVAVVELRRVQDK